MRTYKGLFRPKNLRKYRGNPSNIIYRSSWELFFMRWCDQNNAVIEWSSEETIIPYLWPDGSVHRYFVDFRILFSDHTTKLIEIKPDSQTKMPNINKRMSKSLRESLVNYVKNSCKWKYAKKYAEDRGWVFEVWTEKTLKNLGIL